MSAPRFGTVPPGHPARRRLGAYGLANVAGRLLVVTAPGGHFLPGGGIDPGEAVEEGLRREFLEETGYEVVSARPLGRAEQVITTRLGFVVKDCHFFECALGAAGSPAEDDHHPRWLPPPEAAAWLSEAASAWAVRLLTGWTRLSRPAI